ncbi:DUF3833 domain-containing protein [Paracoccaceae bacterium]|nr:DUF3833 domain-containing protein [Paracoccaceae bacterium]
MLVETSCIVNSKFWTIRKETELIWVFYITILILLISFIKINLLSFKNQKISQFKSDSKIFDIRKVLEGNLVAEGMVYGISGRLSSTFTAQFSGDWANNEGSFIENFQFSTGKNQIRKWNLIIDSNGKIIGTADDIVGKAVGQQYGSAVMLSYKLKLSEDLGGHVIKVIDWMHLLENGTIFNRSEFRKFGFKVGELVATFRKEK